MDVYDLVTQSIEEQRAHGYSGPEKEDLSFETCLRDLSNKGLNLGRLYFCLNNRLNTSLTESQATCNTIAELLAHIGKYIIDTADSPERSNRFVIVRHQSTCIEEWQEITKKIRIRTSPVIAPSIKIWTCPFTEKLVDQDTWQMFVDGRSLYRKIRTDDITDPLHAICEALFHDCKIPSAIRFQSTCWHEVLSSGRWDDYE